MVRWWFRGMGGEEEEKRKKGGRSHFIPSTTRTFLM
jgi:hypothetical protein